MRINSTASDEGRSSFHLCLHDLEGPCSGIWEEAKTRKNDFVFEVELRNKEGKSLGDSLFNVGFQKKKQKQINKQNQVGSYSLLREKVLGLKRNPDLLFESILMHRML